jgi:uncharacterized damage-inducible protein DinB
MRRLFVIKQYLISHWDSVRAGLLSTMDKFTDADLDFKPFPEAMSVRELMLHIAHEEFGEFRLGIVQDIPEFPPAYPQEDYRSLAEIRAQLDSVHAHTMDHIHALDAHDLEREVVTPWGQTSPLIDLFGHILEHETHHRGELSLILGVLGRTGLDA